MFWSLKNFGDTLFWYGLDMAPPLDASGVREGLLIGIPDPKHVILVVTGIQGGGHTKGMDMSSKQIVERFNL